MPDFPTRDPSRPEFWDERFAAGFTPWDARGSPPALARFLAERGASVGRRVLVPGCGSGYEAALLDAAGFDVVAIDYSAAAIARAREVLAPDLADRVLQQADFFVFEAPPFDWIYERAFLAALPLALWPRWSARVAALLAPGAALAGLFFIDETAPQSVRRRGPPFAIGRDELDALLAGSFDCIDDQPVPAEESLPVFAGREHWMVWRRRP
jgi:SAM-dependent methyltransferase